MAGKKRKKQIKMADPDNNKISPAKPPEGQGAANNNLLNRLGRRGSIIAVSLAVVVVAFSAVYIGFIQKSPSDQTAAEQAARLTPIFNKKQSSKGLQKANISPEVQAAHDDWNKTYRFIWVKKDANLDQAIAQAQARGVAVTQPLRGLHAYIATNETADRAKGLPATLTAEPNVPAPTYIPDSADTRISITLFPLSPPTLSGNFTSGGQVASTTGTWSTTAGSYSYWWYICSTTTTCSLNTITPSSSFTIPSGKNGQYVRSGVKACTSSGSCSSTVSFSNLYLIGGASTPTPPPPSPTPPPPSPTPPPPSTPGTPIMLSPPVVSASFGGFTPGTQLSSSRGYWSSSLVITTYRYIWYLCSSSTASTCQVAAAGQNTYVLPGNSGGQYVRSGVKACNGNGCSSEGYSAFYLIAGSSTSPNPPPPPPPTPSPTPSPTPTPSPPPAPPPSGAPISTSVPLLSGTFSITGVVTSTTGTWTTPTAITSYSYSWYACWYPSSGSDQLWCDLTNSGPSSSVTLDDRYKNRDLRVGVKACNSSGCSSEARSALYGINDNLRQPCTPPSSSNQQISAGLVRVGARNTRAVSGNGCGAVGGVIGVMDTGVNINSDLNVIGGRSFVNADGNCNPSTSVYTDENGHGTAVSGVAAAKDDTTGVVGMAPGAGIFSLRIWDASGSGTGQAMVCAMDYAISTRTDSLTSNDIWVINFSGTGATTENPSATCANTNDSAHLAVCRALNAGILMVAAAGNNNGAVFGSYYPASFPEVLTVTAMSDYNGAPGGGAAPSCNGTSSADDYYADYSSKPDAGEEAHTVSAPGTCIYTLSADPSRPYWTGTSFSAPIVSGTALNCMYWGICKVNTPAATLSRLYSDAYSSTNNNQAYGYYGDSWRRVNGFTYGPLINAAQY